MSHTSFVKRFERNTMGRDFIVGDVHGCFSKLDQALREIGFDRTKDRLFSVGDLIDRGQESGRVLEYLNEPWFHAVMGNHEQMAVMHHIGDMPKDIYDYNGGEWFTRLSRDGQFDYASAFFNLPVAIELETESGLVGIVHAACNFDSWDEFKANLIGPTTREVAMWDRGRAIGGAYGVDVAGVRAVVVGHTPLRQPKLIDNVLHIDTGGWLNDGNTDRPITIVDAATLQEAKV